MRHSHIVLIGLAAALTGAVSPALAQVTRHRIAGIVSDSLGAGIENVTVAVLDVAGTRHVEQSDSAGRFAFVRVPRGRASVTVRRLGYHPVMKVIDVGGSAAPDSMSVMLFSLALGLAAVDVVETASGAPAEFYERRKINHFGRFIDRVELDRITSGTVSDALRMLPGVRVIPSRGIGNAVRVRGCRPTVWMNGMRVRGAELDDVVKADDVAAIEVYNSTAGLPVQFHDRDNPCGGILVWIRVQ